VAAAFDHQAQIVVAREIDRRDHVRGRFRRHRVDTRLKRPGVDPAGRLSQPELIADGVGILQPLEQLAAGGAVRRVDAILERRAHDDQAAAGLLAERVPPGLGGPAGITAAHARRRDGRQRPASRRGGTAASGRAGEKRRRRKGLEHLSAVNGHHLARRTAVNEP
jgi:hypothetical protein